MKLIVGLGNPGKEYENTRHNVGYMVLDAYLEGSLWQEKMQANVTKRIINQETVYFIKPLTYMNLSGQAVRKYMDYYDIAVEDLLIIQDDLDLEIGNYKLKKASSSGGHNGIKSIIQELKTDAFLRLKIGINSTNRKDTIDFVLNRFSKKELDLFKENLATYEKIIDSFINKGIEKTMNIYNTK